jgi:hypothetical protein
MTYAKEEQRSLLLQYQSALAFLRAERNEAREQRDIAREQRDEARKERDEAREETAMIRKLVQTAVPHILANIHHASGCFYFTPKKVCNCGTRPAYEALTLLFSAAFTYYKINHQEDV